MEPAPTILSGMPISFFGNVIRLFFNVTLTVTDTGPPASPERSRWRAGFVTLTVTEILKKYASAGGNWPSSVKISLVNYRLVSSESRF